MEDRDTAICLQKFTLNQKLFLRVQDMNPIECKYRKNSYQAFFKHHVVGKVFYLV